MGRTGSPFFADVQQPDGAVVVHIHAAAHDGMHTGLGDAD